MSLDYATGIIKDYEKLNKKNKKITIQKSIKSFNNLQIFTDGEKVAIISIDDLDAIVNNTDTLVINDDLIKANAKIKELEDTISDLSADNTSLVDDKDKLNDNITYWINKYNTDLADLKAYQTKADANDKLINMMLELTDAIVNEVINNTIKEVTKEHNDTLDNTGLIRRLKGVTLTEPSIDKEAVKSNELNKLSKAVNNKLLE